MENYFNFNFLFAIIRNSNLDNFNAISIKHFNSIKICWHGMIIAAKFVQVHFLENFCFHLDEKNCSYYLFKIEDYEP